MSVLEESEVLHGRVLGFAASAAESREPFERLACDIAAFQARWSPGFRRLIDARGGNTDSLDAIPAVPTDAFRLARVAVHPPQLDEVRFETSGTTGGARGVHAFRTTRTYRELALRWGRAALTAPGSSRCAVVALAPRPTTPPTSSLGFMMHAFMEALDGRALLADPSGASFDAMAPERWLASAQGVDVDRLRRAARVAAERSEPLLVLATSFALAALLDALSGATLNVPKRTVVMLTGGFKGRTRELPESKLKKAVARAFKISPTLLVGEYGMTELSSQLYEGTLPGAELVGEPGVFLPPPWLAVSAVDPVTLRPLPDGEVGLARFVDLANVDSALVVVTQDLVRRRPGGGVVLVGRRAGAEPRGCSLAIEALVRGAAP